MEKRRPQKQNAHNIQLWRLGLGLVIVLVLLLIFFPGHGILHYHKLVKQKNELVRENALLQQKNKQLHQEVELLKSDRKTMERVAREKHGLLKKNEEVYEFKK